jgi:hypothetical protein
MTRTFLPRVLGGAGIVAALVAALTIFAGNGLGAPGSAAQANYAPTSTAAPAIGGTAQVGQGLTATPGSWTSDTTPTFTYVWERCDAAGNGCAAIGGATATTYTVQSADLAKTLRVVVTATTPSGSSSATSSQTAAVAAAATKTTTGQASGLASTVVLPQRLIIDRVQFTPNRLTSRGAFVGRFHVASTSGAVVQDSLVKVTALPYAWARSAAEVRTGADGWATMTIAPTINMPLRRNALVMFVRARVEGQSLLAGSSSRRLVQVTIR